MSAQIKSATAVPTPVFDPNAHYAEIWGEEGVRYVQGKNFFGNNKQFVREAPKAQQLAPLTEEQERDRQKRLQANKRFFGKAQAARNDGAIPAAIVAAERENAQARAAEDRGI
jgi:hypothetical protein